MTGSSEFASLRQAYTWTCSVFVPPEQTVKAVNFYRNNISCALIGYVNNDCVIHSANPNYTYRCLSDYVYTLTIPAESMTEYEQGSLWRCEYVVNSSYRSSDVIIKIASKIYFICIYIINTYISICTNELIIIYLDNADILKEYK